MRGLLLSGVVVIASCRITPAPPPVPIEGNEDQIHPPRAGGHRLRRGGDHVLTLARARPGGGGGRLSQNSYRRAAAPAVHRNRNHGGPDRSRPGPRHHGSLLGSGLRPAAPTPSSKESSPRTGLRERSALGGRPPIGGLLPGSGRWTGSVNQWSVLSGSWQPALAVFSLPRTEAWTGCPVIH